MSNGLLIDFTMCIGCRACTQGCKQVNKLPPNKNDEPALAMDDKNWTVVVPYKDIFYRRLCMHCDAPTCASVCPVAAFVKDTKTNSVYYRPERCMGCRYCMQACPFQVPAYEWHELLPLVRKCIFCYPRQLEGKEPGCAEACPTGATLYGKKDDLIKEARKRLAENPDAYHPHIYGLNEVGGTSTMMLSPIPFEELRFQTQLPRTDVPQYTWAALSKIPHEVFAMLTFLAGMYWLCNRRDEVREAEKEEHEGH